MMKEPVLECSDLSVGYGSEDILTEVYLSIPRGALLPLVGPNGSGKTSLLRAFLGLIPLRKGRLCRRFRGSPPGYVPQQKQIDPLYPISVRSIVSMGLYPELGFWRLHNRKQKMRIDEALNRFGLLGHQSKIFRELSEGMRQKVLLARAFVTGSDLLILDEPTAGLDAASERYVLKHLIDMNKNEGKTILLAHHRLEDLSHLAQMVCLVDQKKALYLPATEAWKQMRGSFWEAET